MTVENRAVFPTDPVEPNDTPIQNPDSVGWEDTYTPGDPNGLVIIEEGDAAPFAASLFTASPWDGWPAEWGLPVLNQVQSLTDTAWTCLDSNASVLSTMPPYLVGASESLSADWLNNPDPDLYRSWHQFAKELFWSFQCAGEAFVMPTAFYATGYPARFHVVPPMWVDSEWGADGRAHHKIGEKDVTDEILHIPYTSTVGDARGHGPLEVGGPRLVAAAALARYARNVAGSGGIPNSILRSKRPLTSSQAAALQRSWVESRVSTLGLPAVLSGDIEYDTIQQNPKDMALIELSQWNEARIAVLLKVPPVCVALPSGGDSMTYANVNMFFDYRWREGLSPIAATVMSALSGWALPRGTTVELNRDEYVRPGPLERAQYYQIMVTLGAMTVDEVRVAERLVRAGDPAPVQPEGVLL